MVLAELAASLHERICRQPARAATSLEALEAPQLGRRGALLFSSSAKHPDAQRVLLDFQRGRFSPATLVTHRTASDVQLLAGCDTSVVTLPPLAQRDGFLATGSILQIATLLLRAYDETSKLPERIEVEVGDEPLRGEVLVLTSPPLVCVATDLEVRLVESGLASVQVTDYRNFAHGRHTGFARRREHTTVIALCDSKSRALAEGTTDALPATTDLRRWFCDESWERTVVRLLARSMRLVAGEGEAVGLDVARPSVPSFGRRLYRLPLRRRVGDRLTAGVERKLLAAGSGEDDESRALFSSAAEAWSEDIAQRRFAGFVFDYDGTVCWTRRRWELPDPELQEGIGGLLERGAVIGFASGRGRSLHSDLRRWVRPESWGQVVLGLYNGAVLLTLEEELPELREPSAWSNSIVAALNDLPLADRLEIEERGPQVSVSAAFGIVHTEQLARLLTDRLASASVEASVVSSGHAVDIVEAASTKVSVAQQVVSQADGEVLAVGDQGQVGGNDHSLLARGAATLSVDRCSADTGSCWFIGTGEHVGPALLQQYLGALRKRRDGFALTKTSVS